jgi:hypothetical protein
MVLAVSNYGSGSLIYFFWQKSPVELITIGSWPGGPSTMFGVFASVCTGTLYCVLIARTQGPGQTRDDRDKTKITPTKAGEERKCQRTAEVTDPPLAAAAWES